MCGAKVKRSRRERAEKGSKGKGIARKRELVRQESEKRAKLPDRIWLLG